MLVLLHRYSDLTTCYNSVFQETEQQTSNGAQYFLTSVSDCYGDYAYVYASPSSVYNLSLANVSNGQYVTPLLNQYIYNLPPGEVFFPISIFAWLLLIIFV